MNSSMECMKFLLLLFTLFLISSSMDTLLINQTLNDGGDGDGYGDTLVSANGNFALGFFSPGSTSPIKRYLGVWFTFSNKTVIWVANRESPLNDTSGVLRLAGDGKLVLLSSDGVQIWMSNLKASINAQKQVAQMLDSGNLVVRQGDEYLWQSFDHNSDTLMATGKLGRNLIAGADNYLSSWKSDYDPSIGQTIYKMDTKGYPQMFLTVNKTIVFRSGPWNGFTFAGVKAMKPNPTFSYQFVYKDDEIYYTYHLIDNSTFSRVTAIHPANVSRFNWNSNTKQWSLDGSVDIDDCDTFSRCGPFGICTFNSIVSCDCLEEFDPKRPEEWNDGNWSAGCVRRKQLDCSRGGGAGDSFRRIDGVKLPDTRESWFSKSMSLAECETTCLEKCSCLAYATLDISLGSGCLLWFHELLDIKQYSGDGQTFYLRLGQGRSSDDDEHKKAFVLPLTFIIVILLCLLFYTIYKKRRQQESCQNEPNEDLCNEEEEDFDLASFDFSEISRATDGFSDRNKLGEGGFGLVFKGIMEDGEEIAVKRLAKTSNQGISEFKNEVKLIAKLQHKNLVRLFGCCVHGGEKLLVYEFMPNKSLDYFIYDEDKRKMIGWEQMIVIIRGIARGLLYLHRDSRHRIIHRDLKASNVLLDSEMNPKISDFGMARMVRADQDGADTTNVVGTYGYMSPEYAIHGVFSTKSDVFSFGVLVLEILSGKRNRAFSHPDHGHNLVGHAWKLWKEKRAMEFIDEGDMEGKIERCIHVGLLCVQHRAEKRPDMASVVVMLGNDSELPEPSKPGFFTERETSAGDYSESYLRSASLNEISLTLLHPR